VKANRNFFIERDRLQSGLSSGVVVIETDVEGGTMHTVAACLRQRRILACVAHPEKYLAEPKTRGNQSLIAEGKAILLRHAADLDDFLRRLRADANGGVSGDLPAAQSFGDPNLFTQTKEQSNAARRDS
jgi:DNA processing protein